MTLSGNQEHFGIFQPKPMSGHVGTRTHACHAQADDTHQVGTVELTSCLWIVPNNQHYTNAIAHFSQCYGSDLFASPIMAVGILDPPGRPVRTFLLPVWIAVAQGV